LLAETGTGKELFARALHAASPRADGPFVALNCGALAAGVLESELFGYAPGAFTGALRGGSVGKLGAANGGTLFLDEIAEMPDALQAALLRVLDDGVYHRVGDNRPSRADFRLVCATCRDLPALVEQGAFRRDLFYRVHGGCITIPSVRERDDRVFVARGLLARLAAPAPPLELTADAEAWIAEHDWPGNVRELKTALVHAVAMSGGEPITRACFPRVLVARPGGGRSAVGPGAPLSARSRDDVLRDAVREAMRASQGNVTEAARRLGVARSTIYRSLRESAAS
jgi:transcriptional regulator with PAS, ATPase and Fis domain